MNSGRTVFAQLMDHLPRHEFQKCVDRYRGNFRVRQSSCLDQFLRMAFAQLTYRESLRDIQACLGSFKAKLYHMGIRGKIAKTALADANQNRDWRIYADFAQILIGIAQPLYADDDFGVQLEQAAYALDSSVIDLCLSLFPWATFRTTKAGIKLHTLLNLRGSIPVFACISNASMHDVNLLDVLPLEPGAFYIMDRGYTDFGRLNRFTEKMAFYVIRAKSNFRFDRRYSRDADKSWIKQHLRIKSFYGTPPNAVKTQIWIAICVYILVAIVKKKLALPHTLYTILQILSVSLFEKTPILEVFSDDSYTFETLDPQNQLSLLRF